ncbi:hypothetical protein Nepgr_021407 [Nepenthes gracilis]|uniref:Uncharacterized protein n=1 Tax=Nepenthes gracilis TaxID=150966 RepID=A0AAD3T0W5_NEPGR|nr:hypothetical protein Nepgr_021407 [Nepenthes gracilis]
MVYSCCGGGLVFTAAVDCICSPVQSMDGGLSETFYWLFLRMGLGLRCAAVMCCVEMQSAVSMVLNC